MIFIAYQSRKKIEMKQNIIAPQLIESRGCLRSKASKGEALVSYCEPLATQVEDPATAGRWGIIDFRSIEVAFVRRF